MIEDAIGSKGRALHGCRVSAAAAYPGPGPTVRM
jgi:hypothetical protein